MKIKQKGVRQTPLIFESSFRFGAFTARYAGLLSSRRKASDVLALALFGAAVLAVAIALP